jgi:hypothetical protein
MSCRISFRFGGATDPAIELVGKTCGGSFLPLKSNAGGNRPRGNQSRAMEISLDCLTP